MSDDQQRPRPLAELLSAADEGRLRVKMDVEKFVYVDRDCEFFKNAIADIQQKMTDVSQQESWGLGESVQAENGKEMVSGKTMVHRYRTKARGSDNGFYAMLEKHYQVVEDFQNLFRTIRERYAEQDSEWAAKYANLSETLPEQPPVPPKYFMRFTSTGGM